MKVIRYSLSDRNKWDRFLSSSKNSHFMFFRDYMEYHSDIFNDFSLIVEDDKGKVIALLPANVKDLVVYSHQGLTFGGFIVDDSMKTETMLSIFDLLISFLKEHGIVKLIYKCIPYTYHIKPSEEDRYALFRHRATLTRRDVSSTINLAEPIRYSKGRKWSVNKAKKTALEVKQTLDYDAFWGILTDVLEQQHEAKPTHSIYEIKQLASTFPQNIKLFLATMDGIPLSGAVVFENVNVVHTQYLANNSLGREIGALDFLIDYLIKEHFKNKKYFDFGISNENAGEFLNTGLISQKEGFGARAVVHDFYEMAIL